MIISNRNLKVYIKTLLFLCIGFILVDVVLSQLNGSLSDIFKGYSVIIIPLILIVAYLYIGLPIFSFDSESELIHIKNNFSMGDLFGRELYIQKDYIESFTVETSGLRKKLTVKYIKSGETQQDVFTISLLSHKKIRKLIDQLNLLEGELKKNGNNHLFV